jgi:hypothetical protein
MIDCARCKTTFTPRLQAVGGRAQRYCSPTCRKMAHKARGGEEDKRRRGSPVLSDGSNVTTLHRPAVAPPQSSLEVEWLDCWPDLHRCVAARFNKSKVGESIRREDALGNDRQPLGHAILIAGEWQGKVRQAGKVVWASPRLGSLDEAKAAVERRLADLPELFSAASNLNRPQPMALAA